MKKTVVSCLGSALFLFLIAAPLHGEDMDVVVMVDVTWSLSESFGEIEQYLLGPLLSDALKDGDTFHLLWFSDRVETMISGSVTDQKSRADFRARLRSLRNLQWTYGHYTDLVGAVAFLIRFAEKLTPDHKKLIILVTDGIHDPPPGTAAQPGQEELKRIFLSQAEEIKKHGWSIHILKTLLEKKGASSPFFDTFHDEGNADIVPFTNGKKEDLLVETAGLARIVFPTDLGTVGKKTLVPFVVKNAAQTPLRLELTAVRLGGQDILARPTTADAGAQASGALNAQVEFPAGLADGEQHVTLTLEFRDNPRLVGTTGTIRLNYQKDRPPPVINFNQNMNLLIGVFPLWAVLAALGGLLLLLALVLLAVVLVRHRGFHFSVRRTLGADAIGRRAHFGHNTLKEFEKTSRHSFAIEMIVDMQRRHIGQRNIRTIRRNRSLTVGGGRSAFLVFLVSVPPKIARIHYDGDSFTFKPLKGEYFPGLKGEVPDCLYKEIRAASKKNYPLAITFKRYVSPMQEIKLIFDRMREQSNVKGA
jgi:hypothetical protein